MKKFVLSILFLFVTILIFGGTPHLVYIEIVDNLGLHPSEISFQAWIIGREDEVLDLSSTGCYYYNSSAYAGTLTIQCGSFATQWQAQDTLKVQVTDISNPDYTGEKGFILNSNNAQFFGNMYGDWSEGEGIYLRHLLDFYAEPLSGDAPLTVSFHMNGAYNSCSWDFNLDGVIDANGANPVYTYTQPGIYSVEAKVGAGCILLDMVIRRDYITVTGGGNVDVAHDEIFVNKINNYPNPFNPTTQFEYSLSPNTRTACIDIFNLKGEKVKRIHLDISKNSVIWTGNNDSDKKLPSGIYLYKLIADQKTVAVNKCILIK